MTRFEILLKKPVPVGPIVIEPMPELSYDPTQFKTHHVRKKVLPPKFLMNLRNRDTIIRDVEDDLIKRIRRTVKRQKRFLIEIHSTRIECRSWYWIDVVGKSI